ncbi:MAG: Soluble attachment protein, partial [Chloroflexota bacterium]|nr:Soluble attachment protein [Chloroflexota bacterium]
GNILARSGRFDEARKQLQEAIDRFGELGDERLADACRSEVAHVFRRAGQLDEALALYRVTIQRWVRTGNRGAVAHQLESIAFALIGQGSMEDAARLLGAAAELREAAHSPMIQAEQIEHDEWMTRLRATVEVTAIDDALAAGRRISMAEAVVLATA